MRRSELQQIVAESTEESRRYYRQHPNLSRNFRNVEYRGEYVLPDSPHVKRTMRGRMRQFYPRGH